jgi:gliding motility-associated-like protein
MMNKRTLIFIGIVFVFAFAKAQTAFHNFGNVQIHSEGQMGFHLDLTNDGDFDENLGLAGFYNSKKSLTVSGENEPIFFDMEVDVPDDLFFEVSTGVTNFFEFINGRIITPRNDIGVRLDFKNNGLYAGENDDNHVDGYVNTTGELDFKFPIGDDFRLRTMTVFPLSNMTTSYTAAYFFEDPNSPTTLLGTFNTDIFQNTLSIISVKEYWDLNGANPAKVTLTWDEESDIPLLADDLSSLRVVGYSKAINQWVNLGNSSFTGTMDTGEITSEIIEPNLYSALTFGSILKGNGAITVYTFISPNGDGQNDTLIIEGLETSPNNELILFNRWGLEVFRKKNYDNSFGGISNGRANVGGSEELPVGTYYYVLRLQGQKDLGGAFFITR